MLAALCLTVLVFYLVSVEISLILHSTDPSTEFSLVKSKAPFKKVKYAKDP